jgi:hypothetical protein
MVQVCDPNATTVTVPTGLATARLATESMSWVMDPSLQTQKTCRAKPVPDGPSRILAPKPAHGIGVSPHVSTDSGPSRLQVLPRVYTRARWQR